MKNKPAPHRQGETFESKKNIVIGLPDIHFPTNIDLQGIYDFLRDNRDRIWKVIFMGDIINADGLSKKYRTVDAETGLLDTVTELKEFKKEIFDKIVRIVPEAEFIMLGGNHLEERIAKAIMENPKRGVLLNLEEYFPNVKLLNYNEYYKVGNLYYTHGHYFNDAHAKKHLVTVRRNLVYGHTHDTQEYTAKSPVDSEPTMAKSVGCLCKDQEYAHKMPTSRVNAFHYMVANKDGTFYEFTIKINRDGTFYFNNKLYGKTKK